MKLTLLLNSSLVYADCNDILDITNSPSRIDSPCSVPFRKVLIEANYALLHLIDHAGNQQNAPNANIRIGLPGTNEFYVIPPNYIAQKTAPKSGVTTTTAGLKHSFSYGDKWVMAVEGQVDLPSGSYYYGTQGWGGAFKGVVGYSFTNQWSLTGMLSISQISESQFAGAHSFNSINPVLTLGYSPNEKISIYSEIFGQSKISSDQGSGFNYDAGILFKLSDKLVIDFSAGQQMYRYLGGFTHYFSAGFSLLL